MDLTRRNFWELSPYCFCRDRGWLTIDDITTTTIPLEGENQDELVALSGLSRDDTALLAGLLSALALLLFLIFLLLCCLFPWGLCCTDKGGTCCGGGKGKKRKDELISSSDSSTDSINLTALDMKIPRPWTDALDAYSESEFDKSRKMYAETDLDKTDQRAFTNQAYQADSSSFFQDGGWFTTSDLESVYGSTGRGSIRGRRERRRSFDETESASESMSKSQYKDAQNMSRSVDHLDGLMTYSQNQIYGRETDAAVAYSRSQTTSAGNAARGAADTGDVTSFARFQSDGGDAGSVVEEFKLTRTLNLPGSMGGGVAGHRESFREFASMTSPEAYKETSNQIVPSVSADSRYNSTVAVPVTHRDRASDDDVISEYRAYKRVHKETTTTTTTTED